VQQFFAVIAFIQQVFKEWLKYSWQISVYPVALSYFGKGWYVIA
jgi:hypothetical protein